MGGFGGGAGYGSSYNPYQIPGYKTPEPASYSFGALSGSRGGQDFSSSGIGGGLSSTAYGFHDFINGYLPAMPYSGSPYGYPDLYPRSYHSLYGGLSQQGPPRPPPSSGYGVPFGSYEPDTYASGKVSHSSHFSQLHILILLNKNIINQFIIFFSFLFFY